MSVSLKGFHERFVTLEAGEGCEAGSPVEVQETNQAAGCTDGSFAGVCAAVENGIALVQVCGFMTLPAGDALALGSGSVALSGGKVQNGTGRSAIVTAIREDGMAELILL